MCFTQVTKVIEAMGKVNIADRQTTLDDIDAFSVDVQDALEKNFCGTNRRLTVLGRNKRRTH